MKIHACKAFTPIYGIKKAAEMRKEKEEYGVAVGFVVLAKRA